MFLLEPHRLQAIPMALRVSTFNYSLRSLILIQSARELRWTEDGGTGWVVMSVGLYPIRRLCQVQFVDFN